MTILELTALVWCGSLLAGFVGSLTGLGGGVVLTPLLTLLFGIDIRYAIGAAIVSVIATSSGAAAAYVREGFSNIRIGMLLEIATTLGAVVGASLAVRLPTTAIAIIFALVLLYSAYASTQIDHTKEAQGEPDRLTRYFKLDSSFPTPEGPRFYRVYNVGAGSGMMFGAGVLSGLLGIGAGAMKVIAMDQVMRIPFKVSTTTSNFMIGVTAAASAGVYLQRGYIDPGLAFPVMVGVLLGSLLGARLLPAAKTRVLRKVFAGAIAALAVEMLVQALRGKM